MAGTALVIFDGDGVLYDTEPIVHRLQAELMNALGVPATEADARALVGKTGAEFYRAMEEKFGVTLPPDMNARFVRRYGEILAGGLPTMPGARELIARLTVPSCIATNSTRQRLEVTLKAAGLDALFAGRAFSVSDVARGKPAPDLFLHAARTMGAAPGECIAIDDNVHGLQGAVAAGMRAIGFVGASHVPPDQAARLAEAGARDVAADMAELGRLLAAAGCLDEGGSPS